MMRRRHLLGALTAVSVGAARARAQSKPERLVFVGDPGAWAQSFHKEASAAFEQKTG
ncbi:MAG: hypothetical protein JO326_11845, partial [Acetobacteraceae bacterium]|nr:hypothetical protein [Acetobacteraceae bacterium]